MHCNVKAVLDTLLGKTFVKNILVGLYEAKGDLLKKENDMKKR